MLEVSSMMLDAGNIYINILKDIWINTSRMLLEQKTFFEDFKLKCSKWQSEFNSGFEEVGLRGGIVAVKHSQKEIERFCLHKFRTKPWCNMTVHDVPIGNWFYLVLLLCLEEFYQKKFNNKNDQIKYY
jgi:hypothetical protein